MLIVWSDVPCPGCDSFIDYLMRTKEKYNFHCLCCSNRYDVKSLKDFRNDQCIIIDNKKVEKFIRSVIR